MLGTGECDHGQARQASGQTQEVNTAGQKVWHRRKYRELWGGGAAGVPNPGLRHQERLPGGGDMRFSPKCAWELVRHTGW